MAYAKPMARRARRQPAIGNAAQRSTVCLLFGVSRGKGPDRLLQRHGLSRRTGALIFTTGRRRLSVLAMPVPEHRKFASPDTVPRAARLVFVLDIVPGIFTIGDGQAPTHLFRTEIDAGDESSTHKTA